MNLQLDTSQHRSVQFIQHLESHGAKPDDAPVALRSVEAC